MFVSDIILRKGGHVFTVSAAATLFEISQLLSARRIGAVLVAAGIDPLAGIISERDLVRMVANHGLGALDMRAEQIMTRPVTTCSPDDSIDEVMELMTSGRFRHLPVVRRGMLLGIVSIGDVVKARLDDARYETEALRAYIAAS